MLQVHRNSLPKTVSHSLAEPTLGLFPRFVLSRKYLYGKEHILPVCAWLGQRDGKKEVELGYAG